jgi:hypothetical protein
MNEYNYVLTSDGELYHYGVKGMKWGVRRYQNYDGSYTRAGVKRFNTSLEKYEKADQRYRDAKASYKIAKKSGSNTMGMETEVTNSKLARKTAKRQLDKDYKHLKQDKLGDQGKALYANGKTITSNNQVTGLMLKAGSLSLSAAAYNARTGNITRVAQQLVGNVGHKRLNQVLAVAGVGAIAVGGVKSAIDYSQNKRLRAYYGHTSNY